MSKEVYQNKYRIPSVRAAWHNYSDGMYFVTICTKGRKHYFGETTNNEGRQQMNLSPTGNSPMNNSKTYRNITLMQKYHCG